MRPSKVLVWFKTAVPSPTLMEKFARNLQVSRDRFTASGSELSILGKIRTKSFTKCFTATAPSSSNFPGNSEPRSSNVRQQLG